MKLSCQVYSPMYEFNDKKYIRFLIQDSIARIIKNKQDSQVPTTEKVDDPLDGNILTVKVPFRYRRVMCKFEGKPVQSLKINDDVIIDIEFTGLWNKGEYSGYTWKLKYIKSILSNYI